jgi:hypothetical protein
LVPRSPNRSRVQRLLTSDRDCLIEARFFTLRTEQERKTVHFPSPGSFSEASAEASEESLFINCAMLLIRGRAPNLGESMRTKPKQAACCRFERHMSTIYLSKLNDEQRCAVEHGCEDLHHASPLLIIAGAGSGKTNTLANRVAHLVVCGVDPHGVMLLTFSRRAAAEMQRRVERIAALALGSKGSLMSDALSWSGTFHAIESCISLRNGEPPFEVALAHRIQTIR